MFELVTSIPYVELQKMFDEGNAYARAAELAPSAAEREFLRLGGRTAR